MANNFQPDIFSSLISDIKTYAGKDPLAPWLRGIRRMKDCLPPQLLKQKLPRFLQRCAQTFESDRRYKNDLRYLRVWLQLMDYVDEPKALLRTMKNNQIGVKRSLFYQAYALYYEKVKNFEEADNMYHLGVQNLAEPIDELQKSYELFLRRIERHKNKKIQRQKGRNVERSLSARRFPLHPSETKENNISMEVQPTWSGLKESSGQISLEERSPSAMQIKDVNQNTGARTQDQPSMPHGEDTVIVKFVDTAIVGKSEVEDACHHGLVEPTINMKEALNAINNMFKEPLETAAVRRRPRSSQPKVDPKPNSGFEVFVDDNLGTGVVSINRKGQEISPQIDRFRNDQINQQPFIIFTEDEGSGYAGHKNHENDSKQIKVQVLEDDSILPSTRANMFPVKNLSSDHSPHHSVGSSYRSRFREDTVVHRFVGSTTAEEPKVENVCHHGLVEPTINLKEAMDDINNMFGKPIDFVRARRSKKQGKTPHRRDDGDGFSILIDDDTKMDRKRDGGDGFSIFSDDCTKTGSKKDCGGLTILCDDDLKPSNKIGCDESITHSDGYIVSKHGSLPSKSSNKANERDFFEPTVCMKEAMDEINKMFGMPLDM